MKKYVKPALIIERYELSQHIADCAWELNFEKEDCQATGDPNFGLSGTLFTTDRSCVYKTDDGYSDYCYHNGSGTPFVVFQS